MAERGMGGHPLRHLAVEVAHPWSGTFVEETGSGRDATFAGVAWQLVF